MPLPSHSITISGGCNCKAIRYKVHVPDILDRPLHPTFDKNKTDGPNVNLPFVCICHCNDCRRASGAVLLLAICSPIDIISVSCISRSASSSELQAAKEGGDDHEARGPWVPAKDVFLPRLENNDNFLASYNSSPARSRFFCSQCGTHLGYSVVPMPEPWPDMLDILLGTFDKKFLDTDWLAPERHVHWSRGGGWIRKFATEGFGELPRHPTSNVTEFAG